MSGRGTAATPRRLFPAIALTAVAALAGCAGGGTPHTSDAPGVPAAVEPVIQGPPPSIGAAPRLDTMRGQSLPIEPYLLDLDQMDLIRQARGRLVSACMKARGFDAGATRAAAPAAAGTQSELRYGANREAAAKYGYHEPDPAATRPEATPPPPAAQRALTGPDGCLARTDADFAARGLLLQDDDLVVRINVENMQRSIRDERTTAAFAAWSGCMTAKGFRYPTPIDAESDPRWQNGSTASPEEISTAVAHVDCMRDTNLVGIWFTVESAYQQREIDAHRAELADIGNRLEATVRFCTEVTGQR